MSPRALREILDRSLTGDRRKAVWQEAISMKTDESCRKELDKYLSGERGTTVWKIIETALKYADPQILLPDDAVITRATGKEFASDGR